jgi:hypothetical protein
MIIFIVWEKIIIIKSLKKNCQLSSSLRDVYKVFPLNNVTSFIKLNIITLKFDYEIIPLHFKIHVLGNKVLF